MTESALAIFGVTLAVVFFGLAVAAKAGPTLLYLVYLNSLMVATISLWVYFEPTRLSLWTLYALAFAGSIVFVFRGRFR